MFAGLVTLALIECSVMMFCLRYELVISWRPLSWMELVNAFSFDPGFYTVLFLFVGVGTLIAGTLLWAFHRYVYVFRKAPPFRFMGYFKLIIFPPLQGLALSSAALSFGFLMVSVLILTPEVYPFGTVSGDVSVASLTEAAVETSRVGRLGAIFCLTGVAVMFIG